MERDRKARARGRDEAKVRVVERPLARQKAPDEDNAPVGAKDKGKDAAKGRDEVKDGDWDGNNNNHFF